MKFFYSISAIIVIFAIGFTVYNWYDLKKFQTEHSQFVEVGSEREKPLEMNSDVEQQAGGKQTAPKKDESDRGTHSHHDLNEETSVSPELSKHQDDKSHPSEHKLLDIPQTISEQIIEKVPFSDLTTDQQIAKLRAWLVKNHDNPAEIEEYLQLRRSYTENRVSLPNGLTIIDMDIDEQIRLAELRVILYPNLGNEDNLINLLQRKADIEAGKFIPINQLPREMWEKSLVK